MPRTALALAGIGLGAIGVVVPLLRGAQARGSTAELIFLAAFAVVAGLWLSFVTLDRTGALVTINPAVCFSFALMLSWGVVAAIGAHLASVAALSWRWRVPLDRVLVQVVQFVGAYLVSFAVLWSDGTPGPRGREWTSLHDVGIVAASASAWLVTYMFLAYVFARIASRPNAGGFSALANGLLFNGALVVLSPVISVTSEVSVGLAALLLLPMYAVARMARLAVERERADRVDALTSLVNRTGLREAYGHAAARPVDESNQLVLMLVNLDRFKYLNDSLGYELGDQILISMAQRLRTIRDGNATVARLGADEFGILVRVPDMGAATEIGFRMVEAVRQPVRLSGLVIEITASAGLAAHDRPNDDFVAVHHRADSALRDAKRRGNDVVVYRGQAHDRSVAAIQLLADFREALNAADDESVAMAYQPQLNLATGTIEAFEALLRWTHPAHGPIDATTVLGLAEQTTVMNLLTSRVIADVTAQAARWRAQGVTPRMAINISARDLYSEGIVSQLAERLAYHQLPAHLFQVEVTESALTTDPVRARATLRQIAALGIDISLDDFGTGFSSLQQIRGTPLAEIKIDRSFVKGMADSSDDAAIVASTINLAHSLGLRAVAEGVEDEPTLVRLAELGCNLAQGWYISRPVPADRVPKLATGPGPSFGD